ncbi:MAG: serine/threonine-protein kinase [Myxococcales bacterium]|nr:serine/threonine protein kinase [Polyangiaceae bacterium]MDW8250545.1 serine/threonine-protein kinase [Myxococcales bacterium]
MKAHTEALQATREVRPGDVIAGKFRVERILGEGGMGVVLAARHLQLGQPVAIKMLLPHALRNPELVARFEQEAQATVRIQSEHVVKVLDVGQEQGNPYMVMEYLEGQDLAATLRRRGPLPLGDAVIYVLQACEALVEAHKLGIVHRDLKPANLFLTTRADGSPLIKVLDFGISKATLASGLGPAGGLTMDSSVMGSPNYMSPEQLKNSKDVDQRTDVWSLGLVLYELLAGTVAFQADTLAELHVAILQSFPTSLASKRPDLPPGVEVVILQCLQKDRNFRYQNVGELALALADFAPAGAQVSIERITRLLGLPPQTRGTSPVSTGWSSTGGQTGWQPSPHTPGSRAGWLSSGHGAPARTVQPEYAPGSTAAWSSSQPAMSVIPQGTPVTLGPSPAPIWVGPQQQAIQPRRGPPLALIILAVVVGVLGVGVVGCIALMAWLIS